MASAQSLSLLPRTMYSGAYCRSSSTMLCLLISPPWRMASAVFRCSVTSGRSRPWVSERMASFIGFPSPSDDDALAVSISCWIIWAVQPVKVLIRSWNFSFCQRTLMDSHRRALRVPERDRHPSSAS